MVEIDAEIKKWGNSFAVRLPIEAVHAANLHKDEKIKIFIEKKGDISFLADIVKDKRLTKDIMKELRKGWDNY